MLTNIDAFLQMVPQKKFLKEDNLKLNVNDNFSLEKLNASLYDIGYEKVSIVLEPYEYAVRGGILDIWPMGLDNPLE